MKKFYGVLVAGVVLAVCCQEAAALSDCPYPYNTYSCSSVCAAGTFGSESVIHCDGGDYGDLFRAAVDDTYGPFIWGSIGQAVGRPTLFCCTSAEVGSTKPLWITSKDGDDTIEMGNEVLYWKEDTYLAAGQGADVVTASPDNTYVDTIWGDSGVYYPAGGDDELYGNAGVDYIYGGPGDDIITGGPTTDGYINTLWGGIGDDTITGTNAYDTISGCDLSSITCQSPYYDGDDTINALGGNDLIVGDYGLDTINGGDGNDTIYGDFHPDYDPEIYLGSSGDDEIDGGDDADTIYSGYSSDDWIKGGTGDDTIYCEGYNMDIDGGAGADVLDASTATGLVDLDGGSGDDDLYGSPYDDAAVGGSGDDCFCGGSGSDFANSDGGTESYGDIIKDTECGTYPNCSGNDWEYVDDGPWFPPGCSCASWPP